MEDRGQPSDITAAETSPASPLAEGLGRRAGRLFKAARPRVERVVARTRPRLEKAARDAIQYARDHEEEIRDAATKLVSARVRGPLGPVVGAVARQVGMHDAAREARRCPACQAVNPAGSKFCNQCGGGLQPPQQQGPA